LNNLFSRASARSYFRRFLAAAALSALAGTVSAQANLSTDFAGPASGDYVPGASATFEITVTNDGDQDSSTFDVATAFPNGARVAQADCTGVVGANSVCDATISNGELAGTGNIVAATNGSITLELSVDIDSDIFVDPLEATAEFSGDAFTATVTETASVTPDPVVKLSVVKSSSASEYTPGETGTFTISVTNAGPSDATGVALLDAAPEGMAIGDWSCTQSVGGGDPVDCPVASGQGDIAQAITIPAFATLEFSLDATFESGASADPLVNLAELDVPQALRVNDTGCAEDPDNAPMLLCPDHGSTASLDRAAVTDLGIAIDKQPLPTIYVPGTGGQAVLVEISNTGPSDAFAAQFALAWPDPISGVTWNCVPEASCTTGTGVDDADFGVEIPAGGSVALNATLDFDSGARADLVLSPSIAPAVGETDPANDGTGDNPAANNDSVTLEADRRADISVTKTASTETVSPGAAFVYSVEIANLGPSDLGPDPDDGSTIEEIGLLLDDAFPSQLLGDLEQCADADLPCWRVCANDNAVTGDYGPQETAADGLAGCPTTPVEGSGDIEDLAIALAAGSTTTLRAFVRVQSAASGELRNTAEIRLDDGPEAQVEENTPNGGADDSRVTTPIELSSDIRVEKTDNVNTAIAGESHSYIVDVANTGFITANNVNVFDQLPLFDSAQPETPGFVPGTISWQCRAFGGACCNTNSSECGIDDPTPSVLADVLSNGVDLPGQSQVRFTITGTLDPRGIGALSNAAMVQLPEGVSDPNEDNNLDTDDDTSVIAQADLRLDKTVAPPVSVNGNDLPPFELEYRIEISNLGPSRVTGAEVSDPLSAEVFETTRNDATWTCEVIDNPGQTACGSTNGNGPLNGEFNGAVVDLDAGGSVALVLTVETSDGAERTVENSARVTSDAGGASDTASTSLRGRAELAITTTDNRSEVAPGDTTEYSVRIENEGPDDVFGARVTDIFPPEIDSVAWSCEAATPIPGELAEFGLVGASNMAGDALVTSSDGRHVYAVGRETDSLFAFARNSVPGANFGNVALLETEIAGIDDAGDAGGVVTGMERPLDIAISPDGLNVYALAKPESVAIENFAEQYDSSRWSSATQNFGCGSSSVLPGADRVELKTANGCAAIFAAYIHDGADAAGTVTFDWEVTQSNSHQYRARAGLNGQALQTLTTSTPGSGTMSIAVGESDQVRFNVSKSSGFGVTTLRITNFRFIPDDAALPSLVAFSRSSIQAADDFGELSFLGSVSDGLPLNPAGIAMTNDKIYVLGNGDRNGAPGNADALISIFDRAGISGVPEHEVKHFEGVPADAVELVADGSGEYLFAGGDGLAMLSIDPEIGQVPAGRLSFLESVSPGGQIESLALVDNAPQLFGRASNGGQGLLFSLFYLDADGNPHIDFDSLRNLTKDDMSLPDEVDDPLSGPGGIAIAPDGEHLAGVDADSNLLYVFRRDPVSGALEFQEAFAANQPDDGQNRGLAGAVDVAFSSDGRHVLIAASADEVETNPPLTVYSRRAPDPLFAFLEQDVNGDEGMGPMRGPNDVAISPDGAHVYTVSLPDDSLLRFDRFPRLGLDDDSLGQHLQFVEAWFEGVDGVSGLNEPRRILVSPDGESVFVTSEVDGTIAVFRRENNSELGTFGDLTFIERVGGGGSVPGLAGAQGMAMDPDSRHLYVAGSFSSSIARFVRQSDGTLSFAERVVGGENGVIDLDRIRDLAMTPDGEQLLGVSFESNALVVFNRDNHLGSDTFGQLSFLQSQRSSIGARPMALAISQDGAHAYVAGENSNSLAVLRRVTDPSSSAFGQVQPLDILTSGSGGVEFMNGPRDVVVSPDGKRIYVAAQNSNAVLVFDRDLNAGGARFGIPNLIEVRRNNVRGVAGLRQTRAVAVSVDSRNVYAVGFGDDALASFRLGVGSVCTAGGSGNIDDLIDIGVNGTVIYRASGVIRPDVTGELVNRAQVCLPSSFAGIEPQLECAATVDGGAPSDGYEDEDFTTLTPRGSISVSKENQSVSVTAGEIARYTVTINNAGPSSLVHEPGFPLTVSDPLDSNPEFFVPGSAVWSCTATGSGSLEFDRAWRNFDADENTSGPFDGLAGITGLALVPADAGAWLAGASVVDDSVSLFSRDAASGDLVEQVSVRSGEMLNGAQSVAASDDGRHLYVASRVSDSITVFAVGDDGQGTPTLTWVQSVTGLIGLNQAVHLALSPAQDNLYVAGANDDAVAAFERDPATGELTWIDRVQNGVDGVGGLADVSHVAVSPDGDQLYALSPTSGSVAVFDRTAGGGLAWRRSYDGMDFTIGLEGAASAVFDDQGRHLYIAAQQGNRIVVLERDNSGTATHGLLSLASRIAQEDAGVNGLFGVGRLAISGDGVHVYATSPQTSTIAWFIRDASNGELRFGGLRGNQDETNLGLGGVTGVVIDDVLGQVLVAGTEDAAIGLFQRQADSFCPASGTGELVDIPFNIGAGGSVIFTIDVEIAADAIDVVENIVLVEAARDPDNPEQSSSESNVVSAEADLAITKSDGLSEIDGLAGARSIVGADEYLYVAGADDDALSVLARNDNPDSPDYGMTRFVQAVRAGGDTGTEGVNGVVDVVLSADGAHVYSTSPVDNTVAGFERDPITGRLAFLGLQQNGVLEVSGIAGARDLAVSPDDRHVYVVGGFSNSVAAFRRDADPGSPGFGALEFVDFVQNGVDQVAGLGEPVALAASADGLNVYVIGAAEDTLAVFRRNRNQSSSNFGQLAYEGHFTNNQNEVAGLGGVRDVVASANGKWVFVLGADNGTIAIFERDAVTGELQFDSFIQDGVGDTSGLTGARSLLLDDEGETLYVAGAASASIARYQVIEAQDEEGQLTVAFTLLDEITNGDSSALTGGEVFGLEEVAALALAPDGGHLYAASRGRDAVLTFQRAQNDTALEFQQILIDGQGGIAPGSTVEYVIVVENLGPSDADEVRVVDQFPEEFEAVQWVCSPQQGSGAQCLAGGDGDVDTVASLPAGGRITIRASGTVAAGATGRLVNTATVSASGLTDPVPGNNSATDNDTVLSPSSDLIVAVDNGLDQVIPGESVTWDAMVSNNGPSSVRGVFVDDVVPAAVFDVNANCTAEPSAGVLADPLSLDARGLPTRLAVPAEGRLAFAVSGDQLEMFRRDPLTGSLTPAQLLQQGVEGVTGIRGAADVVASSDGRFVYVAGAVSDAIALFGPSDTGEELQLISVIRDGDGMVEGIGGVTRLLISPDGRYLYAAGSEDQALAVFGIDAASGMLTPVQVIQQGQNDVDGLTGLTDLAWADDGNALLAVAGANQSLAVFERASTSGELTLADVLLNDDLLGTAAAGTLLEPSALVDAGGEILVAAPTNDRIGRFLVEPADPDVPDATATLVPLGVIDAGSLDTAFNAPFDLGFVDDQRRLYVATADGVVLINLLGEQPSVIELYSSAAFPVLNGLRSLAFSANLRQFYSVGAQADAEIGVWARERGSRCPLSSIGGLGRQPVDIVAGGRLVYQVSGRVQPNATGQISYTVDVENPIDGRELNPADNSDTDTDPLVPAPDLEVLKQLDSEPPVVAGLPVQWRIDMANFGLSDAAESLLLDPLPVFPDNPAGVLADSGAWSCQANLPLSPIDSTPAAGTPSSIAVGPAGRYVYAVAAAIDALLVFEVAGDGTLVATEVIGEGDELPGGTVQGLAGASAVAVSADGLQVYATGAAGNSVLVFTRTSLAAPLNYARSFTTVPGDTSSPPGLQGARDVKLSADQRRVFVAGSNSDAIAILNRDERTGLLEYNARVRDGQGTILPEFNVIQGVSAIHATDDGRDLYAVAGDSEAITRFSINDESGALEFESVWRAGDGGLPDLAGIRAIAAAPGDTHLYVLADAGVMILQRGDDGALVFDGVYDPVADPAMIRALQIDAAGSRAYVLSESADGAVIDVLRRDWNDGSLELWFSQTISSEVATAMAQTAETGQLYASLASGELLRFDEQPLSRCLTAQAAGEDIATEIDLGAGGWSGFDVSAVVHPSARGDLVNTVEVVPSAGQDPNPGNNLSTVSVPIEVVSDIGITKTGPAQAVAGTVIEYQMAVTNAGPSDALGIQVRDPALAMLSDLQWTCTASPGSSCPAEGTGAPDFGANVLVDGQLDIQLQAFIDTAFTGEMINVAVLDPEVDSTDPTPEDQRAELITNVIAVADVSVTKSTQGDVVAGLPVQYQLTASNAGPSNAPSVNLVDILAPVINDAQWTCTPADGAACPAAGAGSPDFTADLPVGSSVTIVVQGTLAPQATGQLENIFSATVGAPATDPEPANNEASVSDPILVRPDVALSLFDPLDPFDPDGPRALPLVATIENTGPSTAPGLTLTLQVSADVTQTAPGCTQPAPDLIECPLTDLDPGEVQGIELALSDLPATPATLNFDGLATTSGDDPELLNNTDSVSIELRNGIDLDVSVGNGFDWLSPDQTVEYVIEIVNIGSVDSGLTDVRAAVPAELLDAEWTCQASGGASCPASGSGDIDQTVSIPSSGSLVIRLEAQVDPDIDLSVPVAVQFSTLAESSPPGDDINPLNNLAVDDDEVRLVMFSDGFETLVASPTRSALLRIDSAACTEVTALPAGQSVPEPGRLLEGFAVTGERLLWVDWTRRGDQGWARLVYSEGRAPVESGWQPVGQGSAVVLRLDGTRPTLRVGERVASPQAVDLPAPIRRLVRPPLIGPAWQADEIGLAACGATGTPNQGEMQ